MWRVFGNNNSPSTLPKKKRKVLMTSAPICFYSCKTVRDSSFFGMAITYCTNIFFLRGALQTRTGHQVLHSGNSVLMSGTLIYGANQLKEQSKLCVRFLWVFRRKKRKYGTISPSGFPVHVGLQELYACRPRTMLKHNEYNY